MKHILIAYEKREVADRVLERAAELAKAFGARVTVTSVTPVLVGGGQRAVGPWDPADPPARHEHEARHAVARLEELGVSEATAAALVGDPADQIVELAREQECDLIVLGAHEGRLWYRFLGGSVDDSVIHHSPVDVLVVH